ncbi:MAG TPA: hypothetical protein VFQ85_04010 [Mycobacteriales bacterium]|nr:hypothetical protein [Mycobacteriales bacterium]
MGQRSWASWFARLWYANVPAFLAVCWAGAGVSSHVPVLVPLALVPAAFVVRALRIALVLDVDGLVVRNPLRTYRARYEDVVAIGEAPLRLRMSTATTRLLVLLPDRDVHVAATGWLGDRRRAEAHRELARRVRLAAGLKS